MTHVLPASVSPTTSSPCGPYVQPSTSATQRRARNAGNTSPPGQPARSFLPPLRSRTARKSVVFGMNRTCLRAAGSALLLLATLARADEPLGAQAEDAAKAARQGLKSTPARAEQAVTERNITVRLLQERLEVPASVTAGGSHLCRH
jgi:hypothetical protein